MLPRIAGGVALAFAAWTGIVAAQAADIPGSADHPAIKRYDGATIVGFDVQEFDEYRAILGPMERTDDGPKYEKTKALEGTLTRILYQAPKERSTLEIVRNYEASLAEEGFETQFACKRDECGGGFFSYIKDVWQNGWIKQVFYSRPVDQRFLAARLARPEGNLWAFVYVAEHTLLNSIAGPFVQVDVLQEAAMARNMVRVDPAVLDKDISTLGHAAIYGIFFDTDQARLKAESAQALGAIAELLESRPDLRVHVVGHTDSVGAFDYNLDLSRRRAAAVVDELVGRYGIAADRLTPNGVGPLAPVASNRSEEGRAENRRVELVEQP